MRTIDEELEADAATMETPPPDKLDRLRAACAHARDLDLEILDLEGRVSEKKRELQPSARTPIWATSNGGQRPKVNSCLNSQNPGHCYVSTGAWVYIGTL